MIAIEIRPQIPRGVDATTQSLAFDGVEFQLRTYWVAPASAWCLDVLDADGVPIVQGLRIVVGIDLLAPYRYAQGCPPGPIFCQYQGDAQPVDPGRDSFAEGEATLYYAEGSGA